MNTMSSFYSSTDNQNDSTGIYYSGVIGKLTKDSYEYVMRFNLNLHKIECDLPDIFEMKEEIVNIPSAWLDQVQIQAPTVKPLGLGMGKSFAANKEGFGYAERGAKGKWTAQGSLNSLGSGEQIESSYWDELYRSRSGTSAKLDDLYPGSNSHNLRPSTYYDPDTKTFKGNSKLDRTQSLAELVEAESELSDTAEAHLAALRASEGEIYEEDPVGGAEGEDGDDAERHPLYEAYKTEYGEDTAEAFEIIDSYLGDLEGCDEGLVDIIQQSFDMLSNKAQAKIQTDGLS